MAEPTAHTEEPAGHHAFPPFQAEHFPSQLVWLTISFVLLYVLMSKIALPRIGAIFAERSRLIRDDLAAAERFKEQSDAAHAAYDKALADARARAHSIASSTREQQSREAAAAQNRLEAKLHERLAAAETSIAATRTSAMGNVRTIAADAATAIVERLIGKVPAAQEVAAALGDGLGEPGKS
jgi:F-type H+-transporting ATPase subunit b